MCYAHLGGEKNPAKRLKKSKKGRKNVACPHRKT
jgi:hypothetical protein